MQKASWSSSPSSAADDYDYVFKVLLIGDSGVGKSSLVVRFTDHTFDTNFVSTIGVDFKIRTLTIGDKKIKMQIWDSAGQERFRSITQSYYRGTAGIILVYDVTDPASFENAHRVWYNEINRQASPDVRILLVGNKSDRTEDRLVSKEDAEQYATRIGASYIETSAKSADNIEAAFVKLCTDLYQAPILAATAASNKVRVSGGNGTESLATEQGVFSSCCS